jgi:DNA polymerase
MAAGDDAARRAELKGYLGAITSDLRQWAEWAKETGALDVPAAERAPVPRQVVAPRRQPEREPQRQPQQPHQRQQQQHRQQQQARPPQPRPASAGESLEAIRSDLGICTRCALSQGRTKIVFGVGDPNADLVIVGEAPGRSEDLTGEPFVGRAGALLNRMLEAIGLGRESVYICNVLKCRPPNNRDPQPVEVATCSPFMHRQLESIAPRVILTVGRFASVNIIGRDASMGQLRRETASLRGIPIVATYHPAYLLCTPLAKRQTWEDLLRVRDLMARAE